MGDQHGHPFIPRLDVGGRVSRGVRCMAVQQLFLIKSYIKIAPTQQRRSRVPLGVFKIKNKKRVLRAFGVLSSKLSSNASSHVPDIFVGVVPQTVEGSLLVHALVGVRPEEVTLGLWGCENTWGKRKRILEVHACCVHG